MSADGRDSENEVVFLTPDEDEAPVKKGTEVDQGASPVLRRSTRKRKSVTVVQDMSKGSGSKKKKCSSPKAASPGKDMPKLPRTPQAGAEAAHPEHERGQDKPTDVAALLLAMEARITSKLDATKKAVNEAVSLSKLNSDALDALEEKVDANDEVLRETLARVEKQEERVLQKVETQVREMVRDQLKAAGFDSQLSAGDLSTVVDSGSSSSSSYANVLAASRSSGRSDLEARPTKEDRREAKFWECRRSLRLWPVTDPTVKGLKTFLKEKLSMEDSFVEEDLGGVTVKKCLDKRSKEKKEVLVVFEEKQVRDAVKAQGPSLSGFKDEAGMRLQVPDHLQKDFQALMSLAFELKQKNPGLRRNVKFDEETCGLFMDFQTTNNGNWRRIRPEQAKKLTKTKADRAVGMEVEEDELRSLLGATNE